MNENRRGAVIASDLPAYARVKAQLLERILSGEMAAGDQLPTQKELCHEFGVSRITITRALNDLEQEGLLELRQGVGSFVRLPLATGILTNVSHLYKQTFAGDPAAEHVLLGVDLITDHPDALKGTLAGAGELWRVLRLRMIDGVPVGYEESFIPGRMIPPEKTVRSLESQLLFDFLTRDCGVRLTATRVHVSAAIVGEVIAKQLDVKVGDPALLLTRVTYGTNDRPLTVSFNTLPAQHSSYFFEFRHDDREI